MSSYKLMRVLVLFDLPNVSKTERQSYVRFRKSLMDDGFTMLQYSIYMRFCRNTQDAEKHISRIRSIAPRDGNIRILCITENQFEKMILVIGNKTENEKVVNKNYVVVIE